MEPLQFYAKRSVASAIIDIAKHREVAVRYKDSFGKRPDVLLYESDVLECAKQGATSFHVSEERWQDPLRIETGMTRKQLDELRVGWDLLLDIDSAFLEFSRSTALLLLDAMRFHNINNVGVKYSGNKGFHLMIPFEAFPSKVSGVETRLLFPEGPRMIAEYLSQLIKEPLREELLQLSSMQEILDATKKKKEGITDKRGILNPLEVVEIDTILISSRHLFRSPYSLNEKTGLVSVPITAQQLKTFSPRSAHMENVDAIQSYLPTVEPGEASHLLIQSFDFSKKKQTATPMVSPQQLKEEQEHKKRPNQTITIKVPEELFPPCVKLLLKGVEADGRKRALFILINFFQQMNYTFEEVEQALLEWNKKNYEPLREGYVKAQLSWHKRQGDLKLPPNCANQAYYISIGVCKPDNFCSKIKNPANYSLLKMRMQLEQAKKVTRKRKK